MWNFIPAAIIALWQDAGWRPPASEHFWAKRPNLQQELEFCSRCILIFKEDDEEGHRRGTTLVRKNIKLKKQKIINIDIKNLKIKIPHEQKIQFRNANIMLISLWHSLSVTPGVNDHESDMEFCSRCVLIFLINVVWKRNHLRRIVHTSPND